MVETLLLTTAHVITFKSERGLTNASGFFYRRDDSLFLVTSKHVVIDEANNHRPDRIEIRFHTDPGNLAVSTGFSIPLYNQGKRVWRQGVDSGGEIDVAAIEIDQTALSPTATYCAFMPANLPDAMEKVGIGSDLIIVGFPLGFHDTLHHLPVARRAINASSFSLRFQGNGYFLTDARTHRGMSGAPVVMRSPDSKAETAEVPWTLLGIHSARLDVGARDVKVDEALGLNCAWFADILQTLTE